MFTFPKSSRLLKRSDFKSTESQRMRFYGSYVIIYGAANELDETRIGITATRKLGKANQRNWWKRRVREIFRTEIAPRKLSLDIVVIVRVEVGKSKPPTYLELKNDLLQTFEKVLQKVQRAATPLG